MAQSRITPVIFASDIPYREGQLNVYVVGGGPSGLLTAILIAESTVKEDSPAITIYEKRWQLGGQDMKWGEGEPRREQMVTIHDDVFKGIMSEETRKVVLREPIDKTWPSAYGLSIEILEERLCARLKSFGTRINYREGRVSEELLTELAERDGVLIIGAEGEDSAVRKVFWAENACRLQDSEERRNPARIEYIFAIPFDLREERARLDPALAVDAVLLTTCQSVLLGSFDSQTGRGMVSLRLSKAEYERIQVAGEHVSDQPEGTEKDAHHDRAMLQKVTDAFDAFGLSDTCSSTRLAAYKMEHGAVATFIQWGTGKNSSVLLIGDAAAKVHFWAGRGMQTALLGAASAATVALELNKWWASSRCKNPNPILHRHNRDMSSLVIGEQMYRSYETIFTMPDLSEVSEEKHEANLAQLKWRLREGEERLRAVYKKAQQPFSPSVERIMARVSVLPPHLVCAIVQSPPWPADHAQPSDALSDISKALRNAQSTSGWRRVRIRVLPNWKGGAVASFGGVVKKLGKHPPGPKAPRDEFFGDEIVLPGADGQGNVTTMQSNYLPLTKVGGRGFKLERRMSVLKLISRRFSSLTLRRGRK